jgi:hypothetical protein
MEPLLVHSVPIYYGTEQVMNDFSDDCMVFVKGENDIDDAIERIIALDKDDATYLKICKANALVHPIDWYENRLVDFLLDIFERPIAYARRTSPYGAQLVYREQLRRLVRIERMLDRPAIKRLRNICHRICNI